MDVVSIDIDCITEMREISESSTVSHSIFKSSFLTKIVFLYCGSFTVPEGDPK